MQTHILNDSIPLISTVLVSACYTLYYDKIILISEIFVAKSIEIKTLKKKKNSNLCSSLIDKDIAEFFFKLDRGRSTARS